MSEADRIARLTQRFGGAKRLIVASGDDAAVVSAPGGVTVTSVDSVVQNVDFTLPQWPLRAVGHKAVAIALSDLAAMGARPGEIYVAAGLPKSLGEDDFDAIVAGIAAAADSAGAVVAGGDLSAAGELWLSVTVVGHADGPDSVVTRTGARPGDVVVVTGELGGARRALDLLAAGTGAEDPRLARQFAPQPRLAAGLALAAGGATAMIDISDGLARDAGHIAHASGVQLRLDTTHLPLADGVDDPVWAAGSGEEYELLATVPPERLAAVKRAVGDTGTAIAAIGVAEPADARGASARLLDAASADLEVGGFDHFD